MPFLAPALSLWHWLAGTRAGRLAALAGGAALALLLARRSGRKAAEAEAEIEANRASLDIRRRADDALQRAEDDTRPAERRLAQHGRLRDDD